MAKKISLLIIGIVVTYSVLAQADCIAFFRYKGTITGDSRQVKQIGLPNTNFLDGHVKKSDQNAFKIFNIGDTIFNLPLITHMSSEFCGTQEDIITYFFKKKAEYIVRIFQNQSNKSFIEVTVPLKAIKFSTELIDNKKQIIIDLGHIKI